MYTVRKIVRFLITADFPLWVYDITFKSPDIPIWPVVHGLWCIYLVLASTKDIYNSTKSKLALTLLMSLSQERFIVLLRAARQITFEDKLFGFLTSLFIETATLVVGWTIIHFINQKVFTKTFLSIFGFIVSILDGVEKIRIFYFAENYLSSLNPQLTMVASIGLAFGPEIIEIFTRHFFMNRASSKYTRTEPLICCALIFLVAFQLLQPRSTFSRLLNGQLPQLFVLQLLNFMLPFYNLCLFLFVK